MKYLHSICRGLTLSTVALWGLSACSDNDNKLLTTEPDLQLYSVTVTNLTANQPFSPLALIAHNDAMTLFTVSEPASIALEKLAEGGDASDFSTIAGVTKVINGPSVVAPGMSQTMVLSLSATEVANLSVATMLVNTNDAFTAINSFDLRTLAVNRTVRFQMMAYDAGTEMNSESKGTIPGPVDGGEGFNATRDDVNRVYIHSGVISVDDGLDQSVLFASHRFDNPVMKINISRTQ